MEWGKCVIECEIDHFSRDFSWSYQWHVFDFARTRIGSHGDKADNILGDLDDHFLLVPFLGLGVYCIACKFHVHMIIIVTSRRFQHKGSILQGIRRHDLGLGEKKKKREKMEEKIKSWQKGPFFCCAKAT
jgi:hypothetical protein